VHVIAAKDIAAVTIKFLDATLLLSDFLVFSYLSLLSVAPLLMVVMLSTSDLQETCDVKVRCRFVGGRTSAILAWQVDFALQESAFLAIGFGAV